jgi:hypothetical protein
MLAGMSSIAALAQAGGAKASPFNATLYATVASIIPVLFLALAVEGPTYTDLAETAYNAIGPSTSGTSGTVRQQVRSVIVFGLTLLALFLILSGGVVGEIQALLSLYWQRPVGVSTLPGIKAPSPLIGAVILTVAVAIGPAAKLGTVLFQLYRDPDDGKGP